MANGADVIETTEEIDTGIQRLDMSDGHQDLTNDTPQETVDYAIENGITVHWGFSLDELYRIALKFYKGMCVLYCTRQTAMDRERNLTF